MIILEDIGYQHPDKEPLFNGINLTVGSSDKFALVGTNGSGKSTLLKLIAGKLLPTNGRVQLSGDAYYVPQVFGNFDHLTIVDALGIADKMHALISIVAGDVSETNLAILDDDWNIEERCRKALATWGLNRIDPFTIMSTLSGGEKTKVFLAGVMIHEPSICLLDEPSNHLDAKARKILYEMISSYNGTLVVVSHDRTLLNLLNTVVELGRQGIVMYGGNYDFYLIHKDIEAHAFDRSLQSKEKELRKAKEVERETLQRQQKLDARGKKKQEKAGLPTISMNTLRNNAEKSTSRLKDVHTGKIGLILNTLKELRNEIPDADKMKFGVDSSGLHKGKTLVTAKRINHAFLDRLIFDNPLSLEIVSGDRIALVGSNGSGKTSLIKILTGVIAPSHGEVNISYASVVYIDQDYSVIKDALTVYEQAQSFNISSLEDHEIKIRLARFLFTSGYWDKKCEALSGGEKMRLMLCCLTISSTAPDLVILDEPTNNLDLQNTDILTRAIKDYNGTIIVVSHDESFLHDVNITSYVNIEGRK